MYEQGDFDDPRLLLICLLNLRFFVFGFRHQGGAAAGSWIVLTGSANPDCAIFLATSLILGGLKPLFSLLPSQSDWYYLFGGLRENLRERGHLWMWYLETETVFPKPSSPLAHNGN